MPKDGDKIDLKNPQEMAYVFSGAYTPISCRLVEQVSAVCTSCKSEFPVLVHKENTPICEGVFCFQTNFMSGNTERVFCLNQVDAFLLCL